MTDKNNILLLFDRPTEPIFVGKGDDQTTFDVPPEYLVSKIKIILKLNCINYQIFKQKLH